MEFLLILGIIYIFSLLVIQLVLLVYIVRVLSALTDYLNRK